MSERIKKVSETVKELVSEIVQRKIKDPRVNFVTITASEVSPDLKEAKIYFTTLGGPKKRAEALEALTHAASFIRGELGKRIATKYTPHLTFYYDESIERALRIEKLISKIERERSERSEG